MTRDILQDALSQDNIDLDPLFYSPASLGSLSPTPPPPRTPTVRPVGIGVPTHPRRPNHRGHPQVQVNYPRPEQQLDEDVNVEGVEEEPQRWLLLQLWVGKEEEGGNDGFQHLLRSFLHLHRWLHP